MGNDGMAVRAQDSTLGYFCQNGVQAVSSNHIGNVYSYSAGRGVFVCWVNMIKL